MRDNFVGDFNISVQGATNNTLGSGGQGVCGVNMNFDHEYLGDLSIVLTSPSGQSVTLVGPIGFFGPTDGTEWDVSFVPCGNPVSPDGAFSSTWQNNQPWGLNNTYSGTYYPASGCLQNFNSGSVNGTWSLTVTDGQAVDVGNFYDYEIIFCDPSGINCFSCVADAGNIQALNVTGCEGAANLNLNLPPTYNPPNSVAPPAGDYDYTYVIGGPGGIIQGYEPSPDLSTYPPGNYTVCGLSYFSTQVGDLPAPGSMTVNQLTTLISSGQSS
ncbi:MAG: proprotein convertase P-domain-containing protein, partial [Saprospiraceae bacterium]|nr:proprotein convertase P-domain-containing protein [Saprospiraceae bacterium]